jgi:hypothetical protein
MGPKGKGSHREAHACTACVLVAPLAREWCPCGRARRRPDRRLGLGDDGLPGDHCGIDGFGCRCESQAVVARACLRGRRLPFSSKMAFDTTDSVTVPELSSIVLMPVTSRPSKPPGSPRQPCALSLTMASAGFSWVGISATSPTNDVPNIHILQPQKIKNQTHRTQQTYVCVLQLFDG